MHPNPDVISFVKELIFQIFEYQYFCGNPNERLFRLRTNFFYCFINANKAGICESSYFWGEEGVILTPPFIFQKELI